MAKNINNHLRNHYSNYNLLFLKRYCDELNILEKKKSTSRVKKSNAADTK